MKSLQQVIKAVQYELDCSISELSRKLGKSRNYLNTIMSKGLSEEKEQELIEKLLSFIDDENAMLRRLLEDKEETITAYKIKLKEIINENLDEIEKKNKTISDLEHRIVVLSRDVDKGWEEVNKLNEVVATKDLFIDGQDKEIEKLKEYQYNERTSLLSSIKILSDDIENHKKSMEALAKAGHSTGASLRKAETKNRILTGALIGVGLLWSVSAWVMS